MADYTQDANCVGAWLFTEGSGTTVDNAQGTASYDGTFKASGQPAWDSTDVPGAFANGSVDYDNSDDQIVVASGAINLNIGTYILWFKPHFPSNNFPNYNQFLDTDNARHAFYCADASHVAMYNDGRSNRFAVSWSAEEWHHIVFQYNKTGNVQQIYFDGTLNSGDSEAGTWGSTGLGTNAYIGSRFNDVQSIYSNITEVATFSDLLSSTEINDIMDNGLKGAVTGWVRGGKLKNII